MRRNLAFKLAVTAAIVVALAILAGTAFLAVTARAGRQQPATGGHQAFSGRAAGPLRVLSITPATGTARLSGAMAYSPPVGTFTWRRGYPDALRAMWDPNAANPLVRGAVMAFKAQHHLAVTPVTGRTFWRKLFAAAERGQRNAVGYTYAVASKMSPETLTIWHDGRVLMSTLANTGIPVRPTAETFPVYLRYRYQVMRGTNPDGSHYADPVAFVAYFNGGCGVHYSRGLRSYPSVHLNRTLPLARGTYTRR